MNGGAQRVSSLHVGNRLCSAHYFCFFSLAYVCSDFFSQKRGAAELFGAVRCVTELIPCRCSGFEASWHFTGVLSCCQDRDSRVCRVFFVPRVCIHRGLSSELAVRLHRQAGHSHLSWHSGESVEPDSKAIVIDERLLELNTHALIH